MSAHKARKPTEPAPDVTVRLKAGEPDDPYGTQRLTVAALPLSGSTQKLPVMAADPGPSESPSAGSPPRRLAREDVPVAAEGRATTPTLISRAPRSRGWKLPALLGSLVALGLALFLLLPRGQAPQVPQAPLPVPKPVAPTAPPEAVASYLLKAQEGDAHAMRMLGVMYYYGLNVPQDREKGLAWYRKAAANGSDAAKDELKKLEAGQ